MAINLGATAIAAAMLGSTAVDKIMLGSTEVYAAAGGGGGGITYVGSTSNWRDDAAANLVVDLSGLGLQEGDIVVVTGAAVRNNTLINWPSVVTAGYTEEIQTQGGDSNSSPFTMSWKIMGATPDTSVEIQHSGDYAWPTVGIVHAFRGVDQTTPMDVAAVSANSSNDGQPDPPAITPVTSGAVVVAAGNAANSDIPAVTSSDLTAFVDVVTADTKDCAAGQGYIEWGGSGAVDPAKFGGGTTSGTSSWAAGCLALRPA